MMRHGTARLAQGLVFVAICIATPSGAAQSGPYPLTDAVPRIVAYAQGGSLPATIHAEKLTHINFAFARIDAGRALLDQPGVADDLARLRALKALNPKLKVMVSIGGWLADGFSDAALTDSSRRTFADSVVTLLREYALDGVDLDWEYPGQGVAGIRYRDQDKQNFTLLLKTLRAKLDAESRARRRAGSNHYILTIAAADREYFDHVQMDKLHVYVDWINEMAYDFFNSLTSTTGHQAGLYGSEFAMPTDRNADAAVMQYLDAGVPAGKIVLGVPFYARGFAGVTPRNNGLNQPYARYEGDHGYAELVEKFIDKQGFVRYWDARAQAPYLWNSLSRVFMSYDDPQSLAIKACYVQQRHLGGMMFWELSLDRSDELLDVIAHGCKSAENLQDEHARIADWRAKRLASLTSETGWLTPIALYWLKDGENSFGRASDRAFSVDDAALAADTGAFVLTHGRVRYVAHASKAMTNLGKPVTSLDLVSDADEKPTELVAGSLHFMLIERAGHLGIRVRDSVSPNRLQFKGLQYFPARADWHIQAHFEPYVPEHHIPIVNILGMTQEMTSPGAIVFEREGRSWRLDAILEAPGDRELFVMFSDATSGKQTYGAGRFLYIGLPNADRIEVDFNEAFNPPCAFTDFATCPLPPQQNRLALAIDAGELKYERAH